MAKKGDFYEVPVKPSHEDWGRVRHTDSRPEREGEGYIAIPAKYARDFELLNGNGTGNKDILGKNIFNCRSTDGKFTGVLKSQGNQADNRYAKQFAGNNDLKALGTWYKEIGASEGDMVRVEFTSPTDIEITLIRK